MGSRRADGSSREMQLNQQQLSGREQDTLTKRWRIKDGGELPSKTKSSFHTHFAAKTISQIIRQKISLQLFC